MFEKDFDYLQVPVNDCSEEADLLASFLDRTSDFIGMHNTHSLDHTNVENDSWIKLATIVYSFPTLFTILRF
jgi:hypothetical protein